MRHVGIGERWNVQHVPSSAEADNQQLCANTDKNERQPAMDVQTDKLETRKSSFCSPFLCCTLSIKHSCADVLVQLFKF